MHKSQKMSKQYEQLSRQISNLLKQFQRNRQWADIGNWLSRLQPVLVGKKYSNLPHKINLAKRLAQCLNPSLPAGVHSTTLNVYSTIFNNFDCKHQLLPLFAVGLFPFFQHSTSALKLQLIKIFQTHFIDTPDCLQMITSLMGALLTGLNQNNQQLNKRIYAFCDKVANSYGKMWIDGAVWVNILKNSKTRMAGFKYFMKTFKDRDKSKRKQSYSQQKIINKQQKLKKVQKIQQKQDNQIVIGKKNIINQSQPNSNILGSIYDSFLSESNSNQANTQIFSQISKIKNLQDNFKSRFPNFSTLVVSALCECLQSPYSDNLVKRSALDLMIFYLKLDQKQLISEKDAIHLVSVLLQIIKIKQYSLTRRIYTYLFGSPTTEGIYLIEQQQKKYQLYLIKVSLKKLLKLMLDNDVKKKQLGQGNLVIIEILLKDQQKLRQLILPALAFDVLAFLRVSNINIKKIIQFYLNVIQVSSKVFIQALQNQIVSQKAIQNPKTAKQIISTIDYFFTLKHQIQLSNKSQIAKQQIMSIIEWLLKYLNQTVCANEKIAIEILQLCNHKFAKFVSLPTQKIVNQQSIKLLNQLIALRPVNSIYAGLLTLHPLPNKQTLLPYMNQISLSIVCISNLLQLNPQNLTQAQKSDIFFAIFNLLNCHLWQDQAIEFIKIYQNKYSQLYYILINKVQPSQWLIYWKKMNGKVDGGVIRMLKNLDDDNHLNKQLSKKWLENSKQICSRVVDPIYLLMKEGSPETFKQIYKMIKKVFNIQKNDFITFFFLQRQRYFLPLVDKIFECIDSQDEDLKVHSINMLQFLMQRAGDVNQKNSFIQTTLQRSIFLLNKTLGGKGNYERQIEIIQYFISMVDLFQSFKDNQKYIVKLKNLIENSELFQTMAAGMKETQVPYVRTLYIDFIQKSIQVFATVIKDSKIMSEILAIVLDRLFLMLKQNDVTLLEQIIKGKQLSHSGNKRKKSQMSISIDPQSVSQTTFNVQAKYAQAIQLWNSVKFLVNVSIKNGIGGLPIDKLLSLILQSFPFSQMKYEQISPTLIESSYEKLQEQIKNMTGLKKQVLQIFQTLWQNYQSQIINFLILKGDPRVLIHGNVDPNAVIKAIIGSQSCTKIAKHFKGNKFILPKGFIHYNTQILLIQNQVCYFIYVYLIYCNLSFKNTKKINTFVESILNLIRSIKITWHIQTKLWIVQILYELFERIPFRDLHLQNSKIKTEFQQMTKDLVDELTYTIAKLKNFTHKLQIKTGFFNIFGKQQEKESSLFDFVKIYPPTIHHLSLNYQQTNKNKRYENLLPSDELAQHFLFSKWTNLTESHYIQYLSIATVKTFSKLYIPLFMSIYEADIQKISNMTRDWLLILFPLYEDKSQSNQLYLQTVAQFLHVIINNQNFKTQIIKNMKKNIYQVYMGNDFFKCTKNTLNNWKYIIDYYTESNDLLGQLLSREGLFDIFTRKAQATRVKIKNFQRVCFVIYAGRVDKYENKLKIVLQSLNEVMKSQNPSPALLILILFCIRILFMRLSETALNKMFKSFWPSLITLLIQIYTKPVFHKCKNLLLAGLKVIELVHALELQQFNIHRWIFAFDYFGIRIDSQTESQKLITGNSKKILTPFKFNPILSKILPQNSLKCTFVPEFWPDQSIEPGKRKLVVKQTSIQSDDQLRNHALILMQYMIDLNQRRTQYKQISYPQTTIYSKQNDLHKPKKIIINNLIIYYIIPIKKMSINPKIELRQTANMGRGYFVKEDINKDQQILRINEQKIICCDRYADYQQFTNLKNLQTISNKVLFAYFLAIISIKKRNDLKQQQKDIHEYIQQLPKYLHALICWTNNQLNKIQNKQFLGRIKQKICKIQKQFQQLKTEVQKIWEKPKKVWEYRIFQSKEEIELVDFQRLIFFYAVIESRSVHYQCQQDSTSNVGALAPNLQLFNHSVNPQCKVQGNPRFSVKAIRKIYKDEQIFVNYGKYSEQKFLQVYGFLQKLVIPFQQDQNYRAKIAEQYNKIYKSQQNNKDLQNNS